MDTKSSDIQTQRDASSTMSARSRLKRAMTVMLTFLILATMVVVGLSYVSFARRVTALQQEIVRLSVENTDLKAAAGVLPPSSLSDTAEELHKPMEMPVHEASPYCAAPAIIAVVEMREDMREGKPFVARLAVLSSLLADESSAAPALAVLKPLAVRGIATLPALQQSFTSLKEQLNRINAQLPEHPSLSDRLKQSFSKVITIRRINQPGAAKDNSAISSEAEIALAAGNVAQAAHLLNGLTGEGAQQAAASWLEQANAFMEAERAVRDLYSLVTSPSSAAVKGMPQ